MNYYITFPSTFEAMRFWRAARSEGLDGVLGPAPLSVQRSCAVAWITTPEKRVAALETAERYGIPIVATVEQGAAR